MKNSAAPLQQRSASADAISSPTQAMPAQQPFDWVGISLVVLSAAGFGTLGIFGKLAYSQGFDVASSLFWRVSGGAAMLWLWLLLRGQWRVPQRAAMSAFWLGAMVYTLQAAFFFCALTYASAGITALLFFTYPAFAVLIRWLLVRQSIDRWQLLTLGLAFAGCVCTVNWRYETVSSVGIGLGMAAGAGYALYLVLSARLVQRISAPQTAAWMLLGATLTMLGFLLAQRQLVVPASWAQIGTVGGLAAIATAFPIVLLFIGLKRLGLISTALISMLEPVLAVAMGIVLLGEALWVGQAVGGSLILMAAFCLQARSRPQG
ncbi:MAG: EamA family transporter [Leptolyngbya sp. SIO4C1]|nr:EamA family transporter [Leptolyngbya sp. SIO4C1]